MLLPKRINHVVRYFTGQVRQRWRNENRIYLELRNFPKNKLSEFIRTAKTALTQLENVNHCVFLPEIKRLVILGEEALDERRIIKTIHEIEVQLGIEHFLFTGDDNFPASDAPFIRTFVELAADIGGLTAGLLLRRLSSSNSNLWVEISAVISVIENVPPVRMPLEKLLGEDNTELAISLLNSFSESVLRGWTGSMVDIFHRAQQLNLLTQRKLLWQQQEPGYAKSIYQLSTTQFISVDRARPLQDGVIERYIDTAEKLSLAGFSVGLSNTHSLVKAAASLFSTVPKPATLGRSSFLLGYEKKLAASKILVLNRDSLLALDRISFVVIDGTLLERRKPIDLGDNRSLEIIDVTSEIVISRLRAAATKIIIISDKPERFSWANADEIVSYRNQEMAVQNWQAQGSGVAVISLHGGLTLQLADIGIGILQSDSVWPLHADWLGQNAIDDIWMLAEGIDASRRAAQQSVELAKIDAFSGLVLSLSELDILTIRRMKMAANTAAFLAMLNGIRIANGIKAFEPSLHSDPTPWHALDVSAVLERLGSSLEGLDETEIGNRIAPKKHIPSTSERFLKIVVDELTNPLVPVLAAGAGLSALTGAVADAGLIGVVMLINAMIGSTQRLRTEQRLDSLESKEKRTVRCIRSGKEIQIDTERLVVGDIIQLQAGEVVPADCRIVAAINLEVDESSLTGESLPVTKNTSPSLSEITAERHSMLYAATTVSAGSVHAAVVALADQSEARKAFYVQHTEGHTAGVEGRLDSITNFTTPIAAFAGVSVMIAGLSRGIPVGEVVGAGVSLAVAAVPEGLPLMATMAQLSSATRLAKQKALVRNPRAVEALGRMNVLCADKTGTLTEGKLMMVAVSTGEQKELLDELTERGRDVLIAALLASPDGCGSEALAHMTDAAIVMGAKQKAPATLAEMQNWTRLEELPFSSDRGYHATLSQGATQRRIFIKGAPERLLALCHKIRLGQISTFIDNAALNQLIEHSAKLASQGYRVLAVAERSCDAEHLDDSLICDLSFRGFVALTDPIRPTAREAIADLGKAGIGTKMITGDHPLTAAAIASDLKLENPHQVLTGPEIDAFNDNELVHKVGEVNVFARVTPRQKARIVAALQQAGKVVGMTGDGANDAPAIRLADVGIALGENSTAAARAASDLLVTDGRIETIVGAVFEGRALWAAVRDAVGLLVGGNLGEIGFTLIGGLLDGRSPLNARQLLLINLLTDSLPALAVALGRPHGVRPEDLLKEGPEASLGEALTRDIEWRAVFTTAVTSISWAFARGTPQSSTVALMSLVSTQLGQTIVAGHGSRTVLASSIAALVLMGVIVQTPGLNTFFGCQPLTARGWANVMGTLGVTFAGSLLTPAILRVSANLQSIISNSINEELVEEF